MTVPALALTLGLATSAEPQELVFPDDNSEAPVEAEPPFGSEAGVRLVFGFTDDDDGVRALIHPRIDVRWAFAEDWRLDLTWGLAILAAPGGVITDRETGEERPDTVPRTGNPMVGVRLAVLREPSGFGVDAGLGITLPMASIEQPTPETGPDFQRAPHTEAAYRRALATTGFREPWLFLWDTSSLVASSLVRQISGPWVLDAEAAVALLIPAGRLRADVGVALAVGAYAGIEVNAEGGQRGADRAGVEVGMRVDLNYVNPQRDSFDNELQIRGAQFTFTPELRLGLGPGVLRTAVLIGPAETVEPFPDRAVWGSELTYDVHF